MVKGLGFSDFLGTEFFPDRGVEHLYAGVGSFWGQYSGVVVQKFLKDLGRVWVRGSASFLPTAQ